MIEKKPTVSVIIPAYNRACTIGRAVRSVLDQTYQDFEIIIVDDGSTDNTEEVIKEFQRQDKRFKYIKHKENKGGAAARNTGIKLSSGHFLSFLDSDDQWLPNKLECEIRILNENKDCVICSTGHTFINERTGKIISKPIFKKQFVSQKVALRGECLTTTDFTVVKQLALTIGGFDEKFPARQDWDFWIRITSVGLGIQVPINTANIYVMRSDQISTGLRKKLQGTIILLEKHKNLFLVDPFAHSRISYGIGLMYLLNKDIKSVFHFKKSYNLTSKRREKMKLAIVLAIIKIFGDRGIAFMSRYYVLRYPNSYLLW
jgi:glycosyltransferase involved in cell wall biosynthesis